MAIHGVLGLGPEGYGGGRMPEVLNPPAGWDTHDPAHDPRYNRQSVRS